jgi:hypothetical protein
VSPGPARDKDQFALHWKVVGKRPGKFAISAKTGMLEAQPIAVEISEGGLFDK